MPYKNRQKQLEYMRKYSKARYEKQKAIQEAIRQGKFDLARQIMRGKPTIGVWGKQKQQSEPQKKQKKK